MAKKILEAVQNSKDIDTLVLTALLAKINQEQCTAQEVLTAMAIPEENWGKYMPFLTLPLLK